MFLSQKNRLDSDMYFVTQIQNGSLQFWICCTFYVSFKFKFDFQLYADEALTVHHMVDKRLYINKMQMLLIPNTTNEQWLDKS